MILGPVAENVKNEANKTTAEFQNLANAKKVPEQPAATGQPLTRKFTARNLYHFLIFPRRLPLNVLQSLERELSQIIHQFEIANPEQWENPRATSIAFASCIFLIFMARYFNVVKYAFKMAYFICGSKSSRMDRS